MDARPPDSDLLDELASALSSAEPDRTGLEPLDLRQRALLLRIARDVAHSSERQNAPLASYLIGRFVQMRIAAGEAEPTALGRAAEILSPLIGEVPD
jgi:hypothetical protein